MRSTASASLLALRVWWPIIVVAAIIGGALGAYGARNAPYASIVTLRVDTAGFGEVAQQSIVETARLLVDSNRMYAKVVGESPAAIEEIRERTAVDIVSSSSVLEITVSARTPEQAEQDAEAIAEAAIVNFREIAEQQFTDTVRSGESALNDGALPDPVAEQARRDSLGTAIAGQQDTALRLSGQLSRIGAVLPAVPIGLGARLAGLIGALAGGLVGAGGALVLGVGRRTIRRISDVAAVSPGLVPVEPMELTKGITRVAAETSRLAHPLVAVVAVPGAEAALPRVTANLRSEFAHDGITVFRIDAADLAHAEANQRFRTGLDDDRAEQGLAALQYPVRPTDLRPSAAGSAVPALGMPQRGRDLAEIGADVLLFVGEGEDSALDRLSGRADLVLLVAAPGRSRVGGLRSIVAALGATGQSPIVVLADPPAEVVNADGRSVATARLGRMGPWPARRAPVAGPPAPEPPRGNAPPPPPAPRPEREPMPSNGSTPPGEPDEAEAVALWTALAERRRASAEDAVAVAETVKLRSVRPRATEPDTVPESLGRAPATPEPVEPEAVVEPAPTDPDGESEQVGTPQGQAADPAEHEAEEPREEQEPKRPGVRTILTIGRSVTTRRS